MPVEYTLDEPDDPAGEWWIDIAVEGAAVNVAWRHDKGFGLYTSSDETYGIGPDEIYRSPERAARRLLQILRPSPGRRTGSHMRLKDVRNLVDQRQTSGAERMHVGQSVVSRLERQNDALLSTMSQYVKALGGRVKVVVCFDDFEAPIEISTEDEPMAAPVARG